MSSPAKVPPLGPATEPSAAQAAKPAAKPPRRSRRGQIIRVSFGLALIGVGAAVYGPHVFNTISSSAVVNARIAQIITPIEGKIAQGLPAPGTLVRGGEVLTVVENPSTESATLNQLRAESATYAERILAVRRQLEDIDALRADLEATRDRYQAARIERLQILNLENKAALTSAQATQREAETDARRRTDLGRTGAVSATDIERAQAQAERARAEVERLSFALRRQEAELTALRAGIYVAEERNDVPYTQQRLDEIRLRQAELRAHLREHEIRAAELKRSVDVEEQRHALRAGARIIAPHDAVVWRAPAEPGTQVPAQSMIAVLIDCSRLFVHVRLPGRHFEEIRPGQPASVRLIGSEAVRPAVVRELRGMGATETSDHFAAPVPPLDKNEFLVTVDLQAGAAPVEPREFCGIGRGAEVKFEAKPLTTPPWAQWLWDSGRGLFERAVAIAGEWTKDTTAIGAAEPERR
jgi:multidrug resistance efflux pump